MYIDNYIYVHMHLYTYLYVYSCDIEEETWGLRTERKRKRPQAWPRSLRENAAPRFWFPCQEAIRKVQVPDPT